MIQNIGMKSISVIIPMYNSEKTILRTLDSVRNQTKLDYILEVIVVNDGAKDRSPKIVEDYSKKYPNFPIVLINKTNAGVSSARNVGMRHANGDWFALLDSDDEWLSDKLEIQIDTINSNNHIDFLGGAVDQKPLRVMNKTITELYKATLKDLCIKMFPQTSTVLFRRGVFETLGGFDEKQTHAEDGNFLMKVCVSFNYYYLPRQMVIFDGGKRGFGGGGLSGNLIKMYEGNIKNIKELKDKKLISLYYYLFLRVLYKIKHARRILISMQDKTKINSVVGIDEK